MLERHFDYGIVPTPNTLSKSSDLNMLLKDSIVEKKW